MLQLATFVRSMAPQQLDSKRASCASLHLNVGDLAVVLQICQKSQRIGCVIPLCKLKCVITQPILQLFDISVFDHRLFLVKKVKTLPR